MTLNDVIERDLQRCRDARRIQRERTKEWNNHLATKRDIVKQVLWEIIGGIVFFALLVGFTWLMCAVSGYHFE